MSGEMEKLVAKMYNDGWNPEDIADELGLDEMEVINFIVANYRKYMEE